MTTIIDNIDAVSTSAQIKTSQNALAIILYLLNNGNLETIEHPCYASIMDDCWFDNQATRAQISNTIVPNEFIDLADTIIDYYCTKFAQRRLSGLYISDWQHNVARILRDCKNNVINEEDIRLIAKIQRFYDCSMAMSEFSENYSNIIDHHNDVLTFNKTLRVVGKAFLPQRNLGLIYFLTDNKNRLYGLLPTPSSVLSISSTTALYEMPGIELELEGFIQLKYDYIIPDFCMAIIRHDTKIKKINITNTETQVTEIYA